MQQAQPLRTLTLDKTALPAVLFRDDAGVPDTEQDRQRWRSFLCSLLPRCLLQRGDEWEVPLSNGVWERDVIFSDSARVLHVPPQITSVLGSVAARGASELDAQWQAPLRVERHLVLAQHLFFEQPPRIVVNGDVTVWDAGSTEDLRVPPERLVAWGARVKGGVRLRRSLHTLRETIPGDPTALQLEDRTDATLWLFQRGGWRRRDKSLLSPQLLEDVHARLQRVCKIAGLGADFVVHNHRKTGYNLRRMVLYFRLLARRTGEADPESTAAEAQRLLADLDQNIHAENVDPPNIHILLSALDDAFAHSLHLENATPRQRVDETLLSQEMDWLQSLVQDRQTLETLLPHPRAAALFLHRAMHSQQGQTAVTEALHDLRRHLPSLYRSCGVDAPAVLDDILDNTTARLTELEARAEDAAQFLSLEALEAALHKLEESTAKELVRRAFRSAALAEIHDEEAAADKRLLSELHSFDGRLDDLPLDDGQLLALFTSVIRSPMIDPLRELEQELSTDEASANKAVRVFAANLERSTPSGFATFLLRRMEWEKDIIRTFNRQAVRPEQIKEQPRARQIDGLAPGQLKQVFDRCGRLCIMLGLGRDFLDLRGSSATADIGLLRAILNECRKHHHPTGPKKNRGPLALEVLFKRLDGLHAALEQQDQSQVTDWTQQLDDDFLREASAACRAPGPRLNGSALRRDMGLLSLLQTDDITLPTLLGTPRETMRFLASALRSPVARKLLVRQASRLKKRLDALQSVLPATEERATLLDVLSDWKSLSEKLEQQARTQEAHRLLDRLHEDLRDFDETDVSTLIANTLQGLVGSTVEDEVHDRNMLLTLSRFGTGNLRAAGLDATSMGMLLLVRLTPAGAKVVQQVFSEAAQRKTGGAVRLVQRAQAEIRRRLTIVDAYNQITPAISKR